MIHDAEKTAADYLLSLPKEDRQAAEQRINQMLVAGTPPDEAAPEIPVQTLGEFLDKEIERPPFLVKGNQIIKREISLLVARGGVGKTTLAMQRMIRWGAGLPFFDSMPEALAPEDDYVEGGLRTLMIENEGVPYFQHRNFHTLIRNALNNEEDRQKARDNVLLWGDAGYSGFKVDKDNDVDLLRRAAQEHKPHIVLLEPFRGLWSGKENDSDEVEAILDILVQFANEMDCAVMLAHHARKAEAGEDGEWMSASRGSGVMEGKVATMENFRSVRAGKQRELSWSKLRYGCAESPWRMRFDQDTWMLNHVAEKVQYQELLDAMNAGTQKWYCAQDLMEYMKGETETHILDMLKELTNEDRVSKAKGKDPEYPHGKYRTSVQTDSERKGLDFV